MKDALKKLVDRHLPSPSHMDVVASRERILDRLRSKPAHLQTPRVADSEPPVSHSRPAVLIATAAAVMLAAAVGGAMLWPPDENVREGVSYQIVDGTVEEVDAIRTNHDGATLALTDGSRVEMRSNSELSLDRLADGLSIHLRAGDIIVNAAKQRTGHLYVQTKDMTVSVIGTVFFVSAADEGSRVGVIEGEVRVREGTLETTLRPGEQVSTSRTSAQRPLRDEIAWSRHSQAHLAILNSFMERIGETSSETAATLRSGQTAQGGGTPTTQAQQPGRGGDPGAAIGAPFMGNPPPALNTPNVGAGTISGVVTDASTGAPLEGALVSLLGSGAPGEPLANRPRQMTDGKGRFIFTHLAPSKAYSLYASRPGYLNGGYRQAAGLRAPDPIRLADAEWFHEGDIKLWRPAAISGTVRDERGEPFVGVTIRLLVGGAVAGRFRWASGPVTQTDDRGMYRFAGLSKGRYLVQVPSIQITLPSGEVALYRPPSSPNTVGAPSRDVLHVVRGPDGSGVVAGVFADLPPDDKGSVYASVFHPSAGSVDQAEPIALEFGANRIDVDIQMTPVPSVSVSGTVTGPADAVAGIPVRILPTGNELLGQAGDAGLTTTDAAGRFTFHHIPAGEYQIIASRMVADYEVNGPSILVPLLPVGANPFSLTQTFMPARNGMVLETRRMRGGDVVGGRLHVSIGNRALSGLVVPVTPTVSVSGHFEWDGSETPPAALSQSLVLVTLEPADGDITLGQYQIPARTNGTATRTFTFENVKPGRYVFANVTASVTSPTSVFPVVTQRLIGATWNERDIIGTPLEVSGDGPVTGIVLRMSTQMNKVAGTVRSTDARVATEGAVIAFPASPMALLESGLSAIRFQTSGVAADGTYELPPMIPGDYLLAAISADDRARWLEPDFLASISSQATRVSVGPASILSQDLRIVNTSGGQR